MIKLNKSATFRMKYQGIKGRRKLLCFVIILFGFLYCVQFSVAIVVQRVRVYRALRVIQDHLRNNTNKGRSSGVSGIKTDSKTQPIFTGLKVGILIPSTSRGLRNDTFFSNSSLVNMCLPSIFKTIEPSLFDYTIYLGIDKGDFLETVQEHLKAISKLIVPVVVNSTNFNECVDGIATRAYENRMDYFVRMNDDTVLTTRNWTTLAIAQLLSYNPPNVGVVGPHCNQGNSEIMTHDMVHRTHLDIFKFYYPAEFTNWWVDDWITEVYKPGRSSVVPGLEVEHRETHGRRYEYEDFRKARLKQIDTNDKPKIKKYILHEIHSE